MAKLSPSQQRPITKPQIPTTITKNKNNSAWTEKGTMKDAVLGEKNEKATGLYIFQVRVTYETQQKNNLSLSLALEIHRLLNKFTDFMKSVDEEGRITAWTASGDKDYIACNIDKISPYTAEKYVGMPNGRKSLGTKIIGSDLE